MHNYNLLKKLTAVELNIIDIHDCEILFDLVDIPIPKKH